MAPSGRRALIVNRNLIIGEGDATAEGGFISLPGLMMTGTIEEIWRMDYDAPKLAVGLRIRTTAGPVLSVFLGGEVNSGVFSAAGGIAEGPPLPGSTSGRVYSTVSQECHVSRSGIACNPPS